MEKQSWHRALLGIILLLSVILALSAAHFGRENKPEKTERNSGMEEISGTLLDLLRKVQTSIVIHWKLLSNRDISAI